ncbi:MAG: 2OG-Fe(II) oxygenase family protein [Pseudomonadota bacterium]
MGEFDAIPVLDLAPLKSGEDTSQLARAFRTAYGETGFAYVINHGIDPDLKAEIFAASKAFHALPDAAKQSNALNSQHRGYIAINTSTDVNSDLAEVTKPNQSASFMMMREDAHADPAVYLSGPNQWPALEGFRETCEAYAQAMSDLGYRLMTLALEAIGARDPHVLAAFETPTIWLRLLRYPPQPAQAPDDLYGSAPHKDFGCLTLLAQDDVGGLQVQTPSGAWVDAPPRADAFVVNVGDMLHRMSNGILRSTPHRVINTTGRERYSVPFFYDPHVSHSVAPVPGTGAPKFAPVTFGEFLKEELEAAYDAHPSPAPKPQDGAASP